MAFQLRRIHTHQVWKLAALVSVGVVGPSVPRWVGACASGEQTERFHVANQGGRALQQTGEAPSAIDPESVVVEWIDGKRSQKSCQGTARCGAGANQIWIHFAPPTDADSPSESLGVRVVSSGSYHAFAAKLGASDSSDEAYEDFVLDNGVVYFSTNANTEDISDIQIQLIPVDSDGNFGPTSPPFSITQVN